MKNNKIKPVCKNCKHWKNQQAELEYSKFAGICTTEALRFNSQYLNGVTVLDRENISDKHKGVQRFENQNSKIPIGRVERSRYCLVTDEDFGCINFEKK